MIKKNFTVKLTEDLVEQVRYEAKRQRYPSQSVFVEACITIGLAHLIEGHADDNLVIERLNQIIANQQLEANNMKLLLETMNSAFSTLLNIKE